MSIFQQRAITSHNSLSDQEFIYSFEECSIPLEAFNHEAHIRLAWLYFKNTESFEKAIEKIIEGIKKFDAHYSSQTKYHHTITIAFSKIIYSKMNHGTAVSWQSFLEENPSIYDFRKTISEYYSENHLNSSEAKTNFIDPDKKQLR